MSNVAAGIASAMPDGRVSRHPWPARSKTAFGLRAAGLVALTSVLAPATFNALLWACVGVLHPSRGINLIELAAFTLWAVVLGWLPALSCCVLALGGVWLARRLDRASLPAFAIGGAVLALSPWVIMALPDADWTLQALGDSAGMFVSLAATGASFGALWWAVFAGPKRPAEADRPPGFRSASGSP